MEKRIYRLDGTQFSNLDEFRRYFSRVVLKDFEWNGNLNAFNDILRGGFGTPDEGFVLVWENSTLSREKLGAKLFDTLIEIIREHGPDLSKDGVELHLS